LYRVSYNNHWGADSSRQCIVAFLSGQVSDVNQAARGTSRHCMVTSQWIRVLNSNTPTQKSNALFRSLILSPTNGHFDHCEPRSQYLCSVMVVSKARALFFIVPASIVLVGVCVAAYWIGDLQSLRSVTLERVTPTQVAEAMKSDQFFSDYRTTVLIMQGTVVSVDTNKKTSIVRFETNSSFSTSCSFDKAPRIILPGTSITVISVGADATRQPHGAQLGRCIIPSQVTH
jgi:hypothetical protein